MKKLALIFLPATLVSTVCYGSSLITLTDPVLSGDCVGDDIQVVEENGEYFIEAFFSDMIALADGQTATSDLKRCTMKYNIKLPPGYRLDYFEFSVNGIYQISDQGTAVATVSHRSGNSESVLSSLFFSRAAGSDYFGNFANFTGAITYLDLEDEYQYCAHEIPLTTSVYSQAVQPASDLSGATFISIQDGVSDSSGRKRFRFCKIYYTQCN